MSIFHKWKDRVFARKVPAIIVQDSETIEIREDLVKESNHLKDVWNDKGYEIQTNPKRMIINGKQQAGYICSSWGVTADLVEDIRFRPSGATEQIIKVRWDGVIGKLTSVDVIEKGMDLVGSMKRALMFFGVGLLLGWLILAPLMSQILR